jgi:dTDP-4-dehydrorhamnose reductase
LYICIPKNKNMESILVTGSKGQLGTALYNVSGCFAGFQMYFTDIDTLDILDKSCIESVIAAQRVGTVINCAAYTAVDRAEDDAERCMRVNCDAVRNIGEAAAAAGARVIHVSTDYVFDGKNTRPYREDDAVNPSSAYGRSKLAGEQALLAACRDSVIIRTAWLYSETGANFVKTMLRLGAERDAVSVVADQWGTPTYAADLADAIMAVVTSGKFVPGIYHYSDEGVCTWYDFAVKIFELAGVKCKANPLATDEYPVRAMRPAYSVLDKTKIRETYGVVTPGWEDSLRKCLNNMNP